MQVSVLAGTIPNISRELVRYRVRSVTATVSPDRLTLTVAVPRAYRNKRNFSIDFDNVRYWVKQAYADRLVMYSPVHPNPVSSIVTFYPAVGVEVRPKGDFLSSEDALVLAELQDFSVAGEIRDTENVLTMYLPAFKLPQSSCATDCEPDFQIDLVINGEIIKSFDFFSSIAFQSWNLIFLLGGKGMCHSFCGCHSSGISAASNAAFIAAVAAARAGVKQEMTASADMVISNALVNPECHHLVIELTPLPAPTLPSPFSVTLAADLPAAMEITLVDATSGANNSPVTITAVGGLIGGQTSHILAGDGDSVVLSKIGSNWIVKAEQ